MRRKSFFALGLLVAPFVFQATAGAGRLQNSPANHKTPSRTPAAEVRAACDLANTIAAKTPGVSIKRRTGTFTDETLPKPVFGCGMAISGSFAWAEQTGDAVTRLRNAFEARGWQEMAAYGADGTDATSFAYRNGDVSCFVRGTWDGGADDEPAIPPEDWYKATVFCTSPAFPERRF